MSEVNSTIFSKKKEQEANCIIFSKKKEEKPPSPYWFFILELEHELKINRFELDKSQKVGDIWLVVKDLYQYNVRKIKNQLKTKKEIYYLKNSTLDESRIENPWIDEYIRFITGEDCSDS